MAWKDKRPDYHNGVIEEDKKSKTIIEKFAYEAISKFYTKINEIEPWERERADLERKISSLEYALRTVGRGEPDAALESDPLIEKFIVNCASKVVRTIDDLSVELVSVNEKNNHFRSRNETLEFEIDQLRAIVRISSGNSAEYRERVSELNNIAVRVDRETGMLKRSLEDTSSCDNFTIYEERMKSVEILMNELMKKLENDREAMLAVEKPRWSEYMKKITKLEVCSESLLRQLSRTEAELRARSCGIEWSDIVEYPKVVGEMEKLVKRVSFELKTLKSVPTKIGTRVGGESCVQYLKRIRTLEKHVASSLPIIDKLIIDSKEVPREEKGKKDAEHFRVFSNSRDGIEALEVLAKKLKTGIKELEISVASGDSTNLIQRIRELERSTRRLKNELVAKDERNNSLGLELTGAKIAYSEKVEALGKLQKKYERATCRMRKRGIDLENEDRKIGNLLRELEQSKFGAEETKNLRDELNELRPEMENFRLERATLLEEINRMRATVEERNDQLVNISKQKESIERALTKEENEMRKNLAIALEEIKLLKQDNSELKNDLESVSKRPVGCDVSIDCQINCAEAEEATKESRRLKVFLEETTENLECTENKLTVLNNELIQLTNEKSKIELEISRMKTQNEALIVHLNSEKATTSETLQNYDKLMIDFQLLNSDIESLTIERSSIRKDLEVSERERNSSRAEIDEIRRENVILRHELLSLKIQLNKLTQELEQSNAKNLEIDELLKKLNEESRDQSIRIDSLTKDNEDLNNKLDSARSDKLNIAGALNDSRLKYEESNNQLNSKILEVKDVQERLRVTLRDFDELKTGEASAKLEVARLLEEKTSLRETIDASNRDKKNVEERLESLDNEYRALKNQLVVSENENRSLVDDSSILKRKADKLIEELKNLAIDREKDTRDSLSLVAERERTTEIMQRKLDEFEIVQESLKLELSRLKDENTSLRSEYERITDENEKMRLRGGVKKSGELNRVRVENESMKLELAKLRIANTGADRMQLGLAKSEREKLCAEIVSLRTENCEMRMLLNKVRATNTKLEEQRNLLKIANDLLKRDLEDAKNKIACGDKNTKESKVTIGTLMDTLEELKERNRLSIKDAEEMRSENEKLDRESSNLKKSLESTKFEDQALRQEIDILRSALKRVNDDNSKRRMDFAETEEELVALKGELSRARAENDILRTELDAKGSESSRLESEKATLKDELEELKRTRILADVEGNELRGEYEKLKEHKIALERNLMDALKEIGKYTIATAKLNGLENKLKGVLEDYVVTKKLLRSANDEVNHLRRLTGPCMRSVEYGEKIQAT